MASVLQPFHDSINAELSALRQEIRSLSSELDTSGSSTVMGPAITAGRLSPGDLAARILADEYLGSDRVGSTDMVQARKNVRQLLDEYAKDIALACVKEARIIMQSEYISKAASRSQGVFDRLQAIEDKSAALIRATNRIPGAGKMSAQRKVAKERYDKSMVLITEIASRLNHQRQTIAELTTEINTMLYGSMGAADPAVLKSKQTTRDSVETESKYATRTLANHFNPGNNSAARRDVKGEVSKFWCPDDIAKGKGADFMKRNLKTLYQQATEFWAVLPECDLTCNSFDPSSGSYHKPPTGADGFSGVTEDLRASYSEQSASLYDKLESKIPAAIMTKVKSTFGHGKGDSLSFACPVGDGPSLIFCIAALFRPSGETYREDLEAKVYNSAQKLKDGASPRKWVSDVRELLQEVLELGVTLKWAQCGKLFVRMLSERSNTFSQTLLPFSNTTGVVDTDDCAVALDAMLALVEKGCDELEASGMATNIRANMADRSSKGSKQCSFGLECFRRDCSFIHPAGWDSKAASERARAKRNAGWSGAPSKHIGHGKGGHGKGGDGSKLCKALKCQTPSGQEFCKPCHRKGIETGSITRKDGNKKTIANYEDKDKFGITSKDVRSFKAMIRLLKNSDSEEPVTKRAKAATKLPSVFERLDTPAPVAILKKRAAAAMADAEDDEKEARREELLEQLALLDQ